MVSAQVEAQTHSDDRRAPENLSKKRPPVSASIVAGACPEISGRAFKYRAVVVSREFGPGYISNGVKRPPLFRSRNGMEDEARPEGARARHRGERLKLGS